MFLLWSPDCDLLAAFCHRSSEDGGDPRGGIQAQESRLEM